MDLTRLLTRPKTVPRRTTAAPGLGLRTRAAGEVAKLEKWPNDVVGGPGSQGTKDWTPCTELHGKAWKRRYLTENLEWIERHKPCGRQGLPCFCVSALLNGVQEVA